MLEVEALAPRYDSISSRVTALTKASPSTESRTCWIFSATKSLINLIADSDSTRKDEIDAFSSRTARVWFTINGRNFITPYSCSGTRVRLRRNSFQLSHRRKPVAANNVNTFAMKLKPVSVSIDCTSAMSLLSRESKSPTLART